MNNKCIHMTEGSLKNSSACCHICNSVYIAQPLTPKLSRDIIRDVIKREIQKRNTSHYQYDADGHAESVLIALENLGILNK